ncbi:MAG TPA: hypothetical protein VGU44_01445 [Gammaproteobacteria bacterium]|nr:hypothetical protein [Gammaproteobacteria bacterium]
MNNKSYESHDEHTGSRVLPTEEKLKKAEEKVEKHVSDAKNATSELVQKNPLTSLCFAALAGAVIALVLTK